ncbi:unnamed protein product [Closterium sp. NIES-53]
MGCSPTPLSCPFSTPFPHPLPPHQASVDVVKTIAVPLDASLSDIIVRLLVNPIPPTHPTARVLLHPSYPRFHQASVDVVKSIAVPLDASLSDIIVRLLAAQKLESTVFILQLNLALIVPVLTAASEVGMMTPGYVWIATEGVTSELENLPELSTEGMIGTRVLVPPNPQLSEFERAWQADGDGNMINGGAAFDQTTTLYTLFAHDSLSLIARAIHSMLYPNSPPSYPPPPATNGNASGNGNGLNSTGRLAGAEAATGGVGAGGGGTSGGVVGLERWQAVELPKGGGVLTDLARLQENLGACMIGSASAW